MRCFLCFLALLGAAPAALATHLLGGHISAKPVAGQAFTYGITVTMLADYVSGRAAIEGATVVTVCFGDGNTAEVNRLASNLSFTPNGATALLTYQTTYTYAGPGTYALRAAFISRNAGVRNTPNSEGRTLAVQTTLMVSVQLRNATPTFTLPATGFQLPLNQRVDLSLAATDVDGDSLSYRLALPLTSRSADNLPTTLCKEPFLTYPDYQFPNEVKRVGTYRLNARTGQLNWDVPTEIGQYAVAIVVSEWRQGAKISETQFEVNVLVLDRGGSPVTPPAYEPAQLTGGGLVLATTPPDADELQLSISPNPTAAGYVEVELANTYAAPATLQLLDSRGRTQQTIQLNGLQSRHSFDLSGQPAGLYFIRAESNGRQVVRKVVKE
jgi:hypothetical protein